MLQVACLCLWIPQTILSAQEVRLFDRTIQVHGFASQGFIYTDNNNWLTMHTSQGSGAFTDFGVNVSTPIGDKLRVGAQLYDRNLGNLGEWHPSLDWAVADYRFTSWFGIRGGKVKTTLGLYNDTQDLDFLHTFALLPQSVYPTDLRDATIAHLGGDIYGTIALPGQGGSLQYTVYAGHRGDSVYSGYPYLLSQFIRLRRLGGLQYGADLRWKTPLKGLLLGISRMDQDTTGRGTGLSPFPPQLGFQPYWERSRSDWTNQFYGEYTAGKVRIDSEYRRYVRDQIISNGTSENWNDVRGWYVSGAYRINHRLELGSYYSHYTVTDVYSGAVATFLPNSTDTSAPSNHTYDKVVTAHVDVNRFWNIKIEGHFMDGYAAGPYPAGFYRQLNPQGFSRNTNALVLKTGFNF